MFKGSIVALITPFKDGNLDEDSYISIIQYHLRNGTNGLVPAGTTGECPTISHDEHKKIIQLCVNESNGKIPVIAGTGSNSTKEAVSLTQYAEKAGADAALVVTPYYNKPTQEGLYQHFKAINDNCSIPIIIYNIPGRSVVDMSIDTMNELSKIPNIIGVKDATNDLFRPLLTRTKIKKDFCYLSGEDGTAIPYLAQGGHGCISVTANIAPKLCSEMHNSWRNNEIDKALKINLKLAKIHHALFVETSPGPVKFAAELLDLCSSDTRLPLVPIKESTKNLVRNSMIEVGLIS